MMRAVAEGSSLAASATLPPDHLPSSTTTTYASLDTSSLLARRGLVIVLLYMGLSTLAFRFAEDWPWIDAFYFCTVLVTTVGYGDITPNTPVGKTLAVVVTLFGLILVATSLGAVLGRIEVSTKHAVSHRRTLLISLGSILALILMGVLLARLSSDWPLADCAYWAVITLTTVGLGDLVPVTGAARLCTALYALLAVAGFANAMGRLVAAISDMEADRAIARFLRQGVTKELIHEIDSDGSGHVDKLEFLEHMLVKMGKLKSHEFTAVLSIFDALDADRSGTIGPEDVGGGEAREAVRAVVTNIQGLYGSNGDSLRAPLIM